MLILSERSRVQLIQLTDLWVGYLDYSFQSVPPQLFIFITLVCDARFIRRVSSDWKFWTKLGQQTLKPAKSSKRTFLTIVAAKGMLSSAFLTFLLPSSTWVFSFFRRFAVFILWVGWQLQRAERCFVSALAVSERVLLESGISRDSSTLHVTNNNKKLVFFRFAPLSQSSSIVLPERIRVRLEQQVAQKAAEAKRKEEGKQERLLVSFALPLTLYRHWRS